MPTIEELRKTRIEKLKKLEAAGLLAYPAKTKRTNSIAEVLKDFSKLSKSKKPVVLAGRIMAQRGHGGATFLDINDGSDLPAQAGKIQAIIKDYKMLSKALLPFPEKWHGLQDVEECLRKRYLDIMFNPEVKEMVKKRAIFWNSIREFLMKKGFLEVETPVLETTPGGADARPFKTHHNALDMDVYLRISMGEL